MKRHRETILPPSAPKGPVPAARGRVAAPNMQGGCAHTVHALRQSHHRHTLFGLMCSDADRRGQHDAESHEKLAQRIEKDVVRDS